MYTIFLGPLLLKGDAEMPFCKNTDFAISIKFGSLNSAFCNRPFAEALAIKPKNFCGGGSSCLL